MTNASLLKILLYLLIGPLAIRAAVPTISLPPPDNVTSSTVRLLAAIGATNSTVVERRFDWKIGYVSGATLDRYALAAGNSGNEFWLTLTGLPPNTVIGYRAWAKNASGWGISAIGSIRTAAAAAAPSVQTLPAQFSGDLLRLGGSVVSANGATVTTTRIHFRLGGSGPWDDSTAILNGSEFHVDMRGLRGGTRVDYYAAATNSVGTGSGSTLTATVPQTGPVVETLASEATTAGLLLRGRIADAGGAGVTSSGIRWSFDGGVLWDAQTTVPDPSGHFACELRGLPAGTQILYQAQAAGGGFTNRGTTMLTTMPAFPPAAPLNFSAFEVKTTSVVVGGRAVGSNGGSPLQVATLEWSEVAGVWDGSNMLAVPVDANGSFTATIPALAPDSYVTWRWRLTNQAGLESDWSVGMDARTLNPVGFRAAIVGLTFEDTEDGAFQHGDGDGQPESGEAGTLYLRIQNSGDAPSPPDAIAELIPASMTSLRVIYPLRGHELRILEPGAEEVVAMQVHIPATLSDAASQGAVEVPFTLRLTAPPADSQNLLSALMVVGRNEKLKPPPVHLSVQNNGTVSVTVPAWASAAWRLQQSDDLRSWSATPLPEADSSGILRLSFPRRTCGFFRMAKP